MKQQTDLSTAALSGSIKKSLKHGRYDLGLLDAVRRLDSILAQQPSGAARLGNNDYLKMKSRISEVMDYFGCFDEAHQVLVDGPIVLEKLRRRKKAAVPIKMLKTQMLAREEVRFCLQYAQNIYRGHDYKAAKEIITLCQDVVTNHIVDTDFPCFGTLGRIMYYLGRVHRQMNEYDAADSCFIAAIDYHHHRGVRKLKLAAGKDTEVIRQEMDFARHKSAICLAMGLGWVSYTRGALSRATSYIMPARILLLATEDVVNNAYLELILGAIQRSQAGRDRAKLNAAALLLQNAHDSFERIGHRAYQARASFELSLAHLYAGDTAAAERERRCVESISQERDDVRWRCNSWILESRIKRAQQNVAAAEEWATRAFDLAESANQPLCKIDALIARSEALVLLKRVNDARNDLQIALKLNENSHPTADRRSADTANHKIEAVCHLNLARTYILENDSRQAEPHLIRWRELREEVEHVSVRELGRAIEAQFSKLRRPFHLDPGLSSLDYKKHQADLFAWLLREAEHLTPKKGEQDKLLDISREGRRKKKRTDSQSK